MISKGFNIAILQNIIKENEHVFRFVFKSNEAIQFLAGQFIVLNLPISEKRLQRLRSYSLANVNDDKYLIELCISRFEHGKASDYFFNTIKVGDSIEFKAPQGSFTFKKNNSKSVFICTGTGIVPFRAMIMQLNKENYNLNNIILIFGTRSSKDLIYYSELKQILKDNFKVCLSREESTEFFHGYVHAIYEELITADTNYYLCGWKAMIDEAKNNLLKNGVSPLQIFEEFYG